MEQALNHVNNNEVVTVDLNEVVRKVVSIGDSLQRINVEVEALTRESGEGGDVLFKEWETHFNALRGVLVDVMHENIWVQIESGTKTDFFKYYV